MNPLLYVGLVLDPRYKLRYVEYIFESFYDTTTTIELTQKVKDVLISLYQFHEREAGGGRAQETSGCQIVEGGFSKEDTDLRTLRKIEFKRRLMEAETLENKSEVERYLIESCEDDSNGFDILKWWKVNSIRYKLLSRVARDVLAIPVSTVASESVFSTAGRVIDSYRTSLAPKVAEALICTQNWLRSSSAPIKLTASIDDIDEFDKFASEFMDESSTLDSTPTVIEDDD